MNTLVEQVIARVPMWQGPGEIKISPLEGGITNRNYRVDVGNESFHLRLAGENTSMLGIDRECEYQAAFIAGQSGIGPEVVHFIEPEGYLVTRFVHGRPILPEELRQPENIQQVAARLHNIHSLPAIPGTFDVFQVVREYAQIARRYKVQFPENFDWLIQQMSQAEAALMSGIQSLHPCHNDLVNANFLLGEKLYILDWEYAGMGDIFFDLANISSNHELSIEEDCLLLDCYFGELISRNFAHFNIMKIMSDFREAMWGLVQVGISDLDFDFREYANKHFDRLTQKIQDPNWNQWLEDVRD
jgi:thiamine kinase-like enzyme